MHNHHNTIKMNPVDVEPSKYIDFGMQTNEIHPKFKADNNVRILKCKKFFEKECFK